MKITQLRRIGSDTTPSPAATVRTTAAQDTAVTDDEAQRRRRVRWLIAVGAAFVLVVVLIWVVHAWSRSSHMVSADLLNITTVKRGHFIRDVAAQGSVVA